MGSNTSAPLLRVRWPDGVIQCELNNTAPKMFHLVEQRAGRPAVARCFSRERGAGSSVGDFLGGGGLGYLVSPGVYGQPDRDELVAIALEQLKVVDGAHRLSVVEPMDEVAYLDQLTLDVDFAGSLRPPTSGSRPEGRGRPATTGLVEDCGVKALDHKA